MVLKRGNCQLMPHLLGGEPKSIGQCSLQGTVPTGHLPVLFFRGRLCTRTSATAAISELFPSRLLTRSMILSVISLIGFPSSRMSSADWEKENGQMHGQGNTPQELLLRVTEHMCHTHLQRPRSVWTVAK